jgi:hypothetical protein
MTENDLNYLMSAKPAELMKLTNHIPWPLCLVIKEHLTGQTESDPKEWIAAGAVLSDEAMIDSWLDMRKASPCGGGDHFPAGEPKIRFAFTKNRGFIFHVLCDECVKDFDFHYNLETRLAVMRTLISDGYKGETLRQAMRALMNCWKEMVGAR